MNEAFAFGLECLLVPIHRQHTRMTTAASNSSTPASEAPFASGNICAPLTPDTDPR